METRRFIGDGTGRLRVSGLTALAAIVISGGLAEDCCVLEEDDGQEIVRKHTSNDGVWQKGAEIEVTGEWSDSTEAPAAEAAPAAVPEPVVEPEPAVESAESPVEEAAPASEAASD